MNSAKQILPPLFLLQNAKRYTVTSPIKIGRSEECQIMLENSVVSRVHAEIIFADGQWQVRDLSSTNGLYLHGKRIKEHRLQEGDCLQIGLNGPVLQATFKTKNSSSDEGYDAARIAQHYFSDNLDENIGEHTRMVRQEFQKIKKKQKKTYHTIIGVVLVLLLMTGATTVYLYLNDKKQQQLLLNIFYNLKDQEHKLLASEAVGAQNLQAQESRKQHRRDVQILVDQMQSYYKKLNPEDKLIYNMARVFGECEINMPQPFVNETKRYIHEYWGGAYRSRYTSALENAQKGQFTKRICDIFHEYDLPPQFFYLAMVESDFDTLKRGSHLDGVDYIAKGMWQFIPSTARRYNLRTGPQDFEDTIDPIFDERCRFVPSTRAAARYIKDLYAHEAFGSGLLAMACYNWGEAKILPRVEALPANARQRNFWQLIAHYKIPEETYNHVFRIFSAAVIGENPKMFGFDFDNPLISEKKPEEKVKL